MEPESSLPSTANELPVTSTRLQRILVISEDSHLALALGVVFGEHGKMIRWESDSTLAVQAIQEFRPDAMLTASPSTLFIQRRNSTEILDLPRPVDILALLRLLEPDG